MKTRHRNTSGCSRCQNKDWQKKRESGATVSAKRDTEGADYKTMEESSFTDAEFHKGVRQIDIFLCCK